MSIFESAGGRTPAKNKFDLSHEKKLSAKMGQLYPVLVQEVLPGDSFRVSTEILLRMAPMAAPVMHRVNVFMHYFFVPNRIIWDEWEDFITGGDDGTASPAHPYFDINETNKARFQANFLTDYMGIPPIVQTNTVVGDTPVNALPFRAYNEIYNEYYRDQDLIDPIPYYKGSGDSNANLHYLTSMRRRAWEKDYFTSARPYAQKGGEAFAPITADNNFMFQRVGGTAPAAGAPLLTTGGVLQDSAAQTLEFNDSYTGIDITDLRRAVRLQEWLEKNARGGSRYVESLMNHFGAKLPDYRAQRPVYLGGGRQPVAISEVMQTAPSTSGDSASNYNVGDMYGHGVSSGRGNRFQESFSEHGWVIGILSVLPKTAYQNGIPRHYFRQDKFDYYWPEFAQIGEQEVFGKEIYWDYGSTLLRDATFGYQQRYAEYKYHPDTVHGDFRDSLDYWHLGRKFSSSPSLNQTFVECAPSDRIFNVATGQNLWIQMYHKIDAIRPMPYNAIPTL